MSRGLDSTCRVLATSRNRASVRTLIAGLRSSDSQVRTAVIRAAIRRRDKTTHAELIRHYPDLDDADRATLCDAHRVVPHHAGPALRAALLEGDATLAINACDWIVSAGDFEMFRTLIAAAENRRHRHSADVLGAISGLVDRLFQDLALWSSGDRSGEHDPSFVRHQVLNALEQSLQHYAQHQQAEILNAFLLLAPANNPAFLRILREKQHACHSAIITALVTSQDSGVIERLVDLLRDTDAPVAALEAIAQRSDPQFVNILLHELKHPVPIRVLHNMKRLSHVAWLETHRQFLLELDGRAQAVAIDLATASSIKRQSLFELIACVLRNGLAEGRRASCQALANFEDAKANGLIAAALDDPDSSVQAAAVRQLRTRSLPEALKRLVKFLDSPAVEVREAARSSLAEFNFVRYRAMFDLLDDEAARTTGILVHKVDQSATQKLAEELSSPSITTRLRGIEMAVAMAATDDVQPQLIELAQHENLTVRQEAIAALAHSTRPESRGVLETASHDPNGSVADAARQSLARRTAHRAGGHGTTSTSERPS